MIEEKTVTGYPSIDQPWLKYYKTDANDRALSTPRNKTLYRYYIENVFIDPDFPVIKYFNASVTGKQFIELIEMWARAFRSIGVNEDEMVPVYGTWSPDIAAIFFALNAIGAFPYFEKLDITEDALRTETKGAKVAVVFEPLWTGVAKAVFSEKRFEKVFIIGLADYTRFPLKQLLQLKNRNMKKEFANTDKFILKDKIKKLSAEYSAPFEVPFKQDRIAVITTSSGTTASVVKGIMDTNESALANVLCTSYSEPGFFAKKECLLTLPPTASTAINCFFMLPLLMGMTVRIDPRADEDNWTKLLLKYKPSLSISTGSMWYSFYRNVSKMIKEGKQINLSFADTYILGGSGVTPEQLKYMNDTAHKCHAPHPIVSGYGCSEYFGVITVDKYEIDYNPVITEVIDVGIPIPGAVVAAFDKEGKELPYGQRGELWVKGPSTMHGYFGKPELSQQVFEGEWLKTGDIGAVDENGYIYCYGRMKSSVEVNGKIIYLFDVANKLRREFNLEDCMVEVKELISGKQSIVVYYVQKTEQYLAKESICGQMNAFAETKGLSIDGYREFETAFPISPTTLKPKTRYTDEFFNFTSSGEKIAVSFMPTNEIDVWEIVKH